MKNKEKLYQAAIDIMKVKGQCSCDIIEDLNLSELTVKQIQYIKIINKHQKITISELAQILNLSKPSVTEMIKKFINLDCVCKQQCDKDKRVQYIHLTERGKNIANITKLEIMKLVDRMIYSLNEEEVLVLINLLSKIK